MSTTGSMANTVGTLNPIRYRGYYYDVETGLYYLQSRYYDPETGRYISPDVIAEGGNIYTYCLNDPINRSDESGYLSRRDKNIIKVAIGVVATVAAAAITVATGGAALPVIAGVAASTLIGAGISAGITALQGGSKEEIFDSAVDGAIDGFMWGGISAFASASFSAIKGGLSGAKATISSANPSNKIATNIYGKAHGSVYHQNAINNQVLKMQNSGQYSDIWLNKSLKTAGLNGTQRPDIIGKTVSGNYQYWEFASKTQAIGTSGYRSLVAKIKVMNEANGIIGILIDFMG